MNADDRTLEISEADHDRLMLSGKDGESMMKTSEAGSRTPSKKAEASSSF